MELTFMSNFEGLKLTDYMKVASVVCAKKHQPAGSLCSCQGLIKVARCIEQEGWVNLKEAFMLSSPGRVHHLYMHVKNVCKCRWQPLL